MTARDLPGPGDAATWGHHAKAPGSPDYDERWQDESTIDADMEELSEWIDTFECAVRARDFHRMQTAMWMAESKMEALIEEWKP